MVLGVGMVDCMLTILCGIDMGGLLMLCSRFMAASKVLGEETVGGGSKSEEKNKEELTDE